MSPQASCSRDVRGHLVDLGGRLVLQTTFGHQDLTAAEIYSLITQGHAAGVQLEHPAAETLPDIAFMTRPLSVYVWARSDKQRGISILPAVDIRHQPQPVSDLTDDHVLATNVWHPLDLLSLEAARLCLQQHDSSGTPLAHYVNLYRNLYPDLQIRDEVNLEHLEAAQEGIVHPSGLRAELYPYQQSGYQRLAACADSGLGCMLADEMGLGKTLQVIALLSHRHELGVGPSLVLSPATLMENWRREIHRFAPRLRVYLHHGPRRVRYVGALVELDIVLASYDTVARDISIFMARKWDTLVLDEAQNVKNPDAQRSQLLQEIPRHSAVVVTGTPIENQPLDIWTLTNFAVPGYLGDRQQFMDAIANSPSLLANAVKPLLLRRTVSDVATELPHRISSDCIVEMTDAERIQYERLIADNRRKPHSGRALAILTKLRQFTAHPSLALQTESLDPCAESMKLTYLIDILSKVVLSRQKALVFSAFTRMSDLIQKVVQERLFVQAWTIDGRTPVAARQPMIDSFGEHEGPAVLILHPTTGGSGLNITAATHVIHYTLEWNPAKEDQATARAHRRGQTEPVFVHRLIYADSIDEAIADVMETKRDLADQVVQPSGTLELDILARALSGQKRLYGAPKI